MTLTEVRSAILDWKLQNAQMQREFFRDVRVLLDVEGGACSEGQLAALESYMWDISENFRWAVMHTPTGSAVLLGDDDDFTGEVKTDAHALYTIVEPSESLAIFRQDYASEIILGALREVMRAAKWSDRSYDWRKVIVDAAAECETIMRDALTGIAEANA